MLFRRVAHDADLTPPDDVFLAVFGGTPRLAARAKARPRIKGEQHYLWRALDQPGVVLNNLVQGGRIIYSHLHS